MLRNLLPFRHPRHRHDALDLDAECAGLLVPRQRRIVPGGADGGEVSRQCIEAGLDRRVRQELDHFPRLRLARRAPEDREARPARKGHPRPRRPVRSRQRRGHPEILLRRGEPAPELAQVPRTRHPHRDVSARELLVRVAELGVADDRRQILVEDPDVELGGRAEFGAREGAARAVLREKRGTLLQAEDRELLPLVGRQQERVRGRGLDLFHLPHRVAPLAPGPRPGRVARAGEKVPPVVENARVDVPGDPVDRSVVAARRPDARKIAFRRNGRRLRDAAVQGIERADASELRDPCVAELRDVRRGPTHEGRQELLVRRSPRDLLNHQMDTGVAPLEVGDEVAHDLSLAAHAPEPYGCAAVASASAAGDRRHERQEKR